jgi:hypothetical protein
MATSQHLAEVAKCAQTTLESKQVQHFNDRLRELGIPWRFWAVKSGPRQPVVWTLKPRTVPVARSRQVDADSHSF